MKKVLLTTAILSTLVCGTLVIGWVMKRKSSPLKNLNSKRHNLSQLLSEILNEQMDGNINPKLHQLKELFQTHWDDLMAKEDNLAFWKSWLANLSEKDKKPSDGTNPWNHGRKEQMMADLGTIHF